MDGTYKLFGETQVTIAADGEILVSGDCVMKGYDKDEANQDGYIINKPVIIQECNIKNLQNSLLYGNKKPWTLRDFRITDCIVQMNNSGSNGVINLYGATGTIKDMTIKNSTFII